jgi:nitroreductase
MDFLQLATERYSVRKFSRQSVEKEKIDLILGAVQVSPTACNNQPQRILVIESKSALDSLKDCTAYHFDAPLAFLICYDQTVAWCRKYDNKNGGEVDASIVTTHMMLQAAALGLGTTWVGYFDPEKIRKAYGIPENCVPVAILPTGYPADDASPYPAHNKRYPLEQTVYYDHF